MIFFGWLYNSTRIQSNIKNILFLFLIITFFYTNAQIPTINYDYWQTVNTYSVSNSATQEFNKSIMIGENLFMIVDTFSGTNPYNKKGIFVYNTTPLAIQMH